jgi:hypothetical protein
MGSGDTAPLILKLGTSWRGVVSFRPRPLYPRGMLATIPFRILYLLIIK